MNEQIIISAVKSFSCFSQASNHFVETPLKNINGQARADLLAQKISPGLLSHFMARIIYLFHSAMFFFETEKKKSSLVGISNIFRPFLFCQSFNITWARVNQN